MFFFFFIAFYKNKTFLWHTFNQLKFIQVNSIVGFSHNINQTILLFSSEKKAHKSILEKIKDTANVKLAEQEPQVPNESIKLLETAVEIEAACVISKNERSPSPNPDTAEKRKKIRGKSKVDSVAGNIAGVVGSPADLTKKVNWSSNNSSIEDCAFGFEKVKNQPKYMTNNLSESNLNKKYTLNVEYPNAKVAQRLASYERLPITDNDTNQGMKKFSSFKQL